MKQPRGHNFSFNTLRVMTDARDKCHKKTKVLLSG